MAELGQRGFYERPDEVLCVIDGLGEDYLETEELAYQREWAGLIEQNSHIFDIVYTSDMRAIPRFNEHGMVMTVGRPLTAADAEIKACVVNELFLAENGLSIGDMVSVRLGDFLWPQVALQTKDVSVDKKTEFTDSIELTIVGAYSMADDWAARLSEPAWHYSPSTIFVPASLLPVEVPDSYEVFCYDNDFLFMLTTYLFSNSGLPVMSLSIYENVCSLNSSYLLNVGWKLSVPHRLMCLNT